MRGIFHYCQVTVAEPNYRFDTNFQYDELQVSFDSRAGRTYAEFRFQFVMLQRDTDHPQFAVHLSCYDDALNAFMDSRVQRVVNRWRRWPRPRNELTPEKFIAWLEAEGARPSRHHTEGLERMGGSFARHASAAWTFTSAPIEPEPQFHPAAAPPVDDDALDLFQTEFSRSIDRQFVFGRDDGRDRRLSDADRVWSALQEARVAYHQEPTAILEHEPPLAWEFQVVAYDEERTGDERHPRFEFVTEAPLSEARGYSWEVSDNLMMNGWDVRLDHPPNENGDRYRQQTFLTRPVLEDFAMMPFTVFHGRIGDVPE